MSVQRLSPGSRAPDALVHGPRGPVHLAELWQDAPVVLAFLRHFG